jgi:hypothetical protein
VEFYAATPPTNNAIATTRALRPKAKGTGPADSSPLWFVNGDHAYQMEVEIDADANASGGLLVFYSRKLYAGLGVSDRNLRLHLYGMDRTSAKPAGLGRHVWIRLTNDHHIVTLIYGADERTETLRPRHRVSGYHHNVAYDFLSLRPAPTRLARARFDSGAHTYRARPWGQGRQAHFRAAHRMLLMLFFTVSCLVFMMLLTAV